MCDEKHYWKNSRCCKKCEPGFHVFSHCTESHQTICVKCSSGEYQPGWTDKARCLQQKYCDPSQSTERDLQEPCRCFPGLQCSPINCEYCERIPTCAAGHGLEKKCVACKKGFFSVGNKAEPLNLRSCVQNLKRTRIQQSEEVEAHGDRVAEDSNQGCGEPEEVSEEEEGDSESRLLTGSCTCDVPVRQPLEVGENEDCSQAVSPGTLGNCSCGSEIRKDEKQKEDNVKTSPGRSNTLHMLISQPISQQGIFLVAHARVQNDSYVTTFDPLVCSVANGNLVRSHFFFCSAQVSGSNNTTFISSGQVMNFSGEVIVVYVGHSSPGSDGTDQGGVFRNPVQEEANESALHFQSIPRAQDSISHDALQDETLPVQEMMEQFTLNSSLLLFSFSFFTVEWKL
uniref:Tumor necrosis factor receptor superfamily, member 11a, NFKB activator n=1 Tax=Takifugu rubripes TaxID=31033 RepID=A0A3B5K468_TAKRU